MKASSMSQSLQFSNKKKSLKKLETCRVRKRDWGRGLQAIGAKKKEPGGEKKKKLKIFLHLLNQRRLFL